MNARERGHTDETAPFREDLQRLADRLASARDLPIPELRRELADAERELASLRDAVIRQVRESGSAALRETLNGVNAALSLVIGVEYPRTLTRRELLDQAREALVGAQEP